MNKIGVVVVILLCCCIATAQNLPPGVSGGSESGFVLDLHRVPARVDDIPVPASPRGYVIGPKDELSIFVWNEPDLSVDVFVRPDGKISLPLLSDIQASGLTPLQLQKQIGEGLESFVSTPQVSVLVRGINSQVVYLYGRGAASPGVYLLGRPTNVMQLLIEAGGFAEFADEDNVQILRMENGQARWFRFNTGDFIEGRDYEQNIQIQSGDFVIVSD